MELEGGRGKRGRVGGDRLRKGRWGVLPNWKRDHESLMGAFGGWGGVRGMCEKTELGGGR